MHFLSPNQVFQEACKSLKKWGMLIAFDDQDLNEVYLAAPYLKADSGRFIVFDGGSHIFHLLFDTEEEMWQIYDQTVGNDGPTKSNPYNGPARVNALACSPEGVSLDENT